MRFIIVVKTKIENKIISSPNSWCKYTVNDRDFAFFWIPQQNYCIGHQKP
jgi:hypothetical protein